MPETRETQLLAELKIREERIAELEKENALLRQKIDLLVRKVFGASSEKLDPAQLLLLLQGMEPPPGTERSEIDCRRQPEGWSGSDIKSTRARGSGGATALDGPISSA